MSSPHVRAKLGEVLYSVFLPHSEDKEHDPRYTHLVTPSAMNGPQTRLVGECVVGLLLTSPLLLTPFSMPQIAIRKLSCFWHLHCSYSTATLRELVCALY